MLRTAICRNSKTALRKAATTSNVISRATTVGLRKTTGLRHNSTKTVREEPSPAFNQTSAEEASKSLKKYANKDMDDSFVGLTGGEIFHEMMLRHKVDTVFGYPGGAILPVYDAIFESKHFEFVLPRHEQGAGHMAEGYARATGKPGVVLVTSGPGATNVITPMADALADGVPLVVFSGQVPTSAIGTDAFQEADVVGISRSCTKWNVMVKNVAELPRRINEAFEIATSGRPGPVLVDLPKDVTASVLKQSIPTATTLPSQTLANITKQFFAQSIDESIQEASDLLNVAKKPVLYVGAGILNHPEGSKILKELSEKAQIPVTTTIQALGSYDQNDHKSLDMLGMHGSGFANLAIQNADLIIALGARFDDRVTGALPKFAPNAKLAAQQGRGGIIHFEISPKNINKVVEATVAVEGDVTDNVKKLLPLVNKVDEASRASWFKQIENWKKQYPYDYQKEVPGSKIKPQTLIQRLSDHCSKLSKDVVVTTGVGQHQMWAAQHFNWTKPRTFITSGGLGTMGYGLPAAIGAQVGRPDAVVIDIDGDASFNMTLTELSTAVQFGIPVKVLLLNNEEQGMVTQWQSLFYEHRYAHTHQSNPNFIKLAEAMNLKAIKLTKQEDVDAKLDEFLNYNEGPVLLEVEVQGKVPVLPMVPAGKGLDEFISFDAEFEKQQNELRKERTNGKY
ncbi:acetolactate synthase catalytic subunit [Saccharomycopsis crataegensis]|uniref:Acetolactate synthase n=1 Tax=Saccharomycopsis crataegensis TaxID=43959 RepID=A0AAV5QLR7_9ASCO|nr:acetolactate synthase catalytic subunit [Saccharomycopsis crataegensis]